MPEEKEYNPDLITVEDEDGVEHTFEALDRIETDKGRYIGMIPVFDEADEFLEANMELILVRVEEDENGDTLLYPIEDDEEWNEVANIFEERLADAFEITEDEDEEPILN